MNSPAEGNGAAGSSSRPGPAVSVPTSWRLYCAISSSSSASSATARLPGMSEAGGEAVTDLVVDLPLPPWPAVVVVGHLRRCAVEHVQGQAGRHAPGADKLCQREGFAGQHLLLPAVRGFDDALVGAPERRLAVVVQLAGGTDGLLLNPLRSLGLGDDQPFGHRRQRRVGP